jgi:hypothetical protein
MIANPQPQPSAPSISLATLRMVLAKGQAAHPELGCRMERAAHIVALRRITPAVSLQNRGVGYWVEASDGSREYWVTLDPRGNYRFDRCTCPDYQQRGGPCKHAIAVRLLQACERAEARQAPTPLPTPTLDPDSPIPFTLTDKALAALADCPPSV